MLLCLVKVPVPEVTWQDSMRYCVRRTGLGLKHSAGAPAVIHALSKKMVEPNQPKSPAVALAVTSRGPCFFLLFVFNLIFGLRKGGGRSEGEAGVGRVAVGP